MGYRFQSLLHLKGSFAKEILVGGQLFDACFVKVEFARRFGKSCECSIPEEKASTRKERNGRPQLKLECKVVI